MPNRDYHQERRDYQAPSLRRVDLASSPFQQFSNWIDSAHQCKALKDPTAMALATVNRSGQPHCRIVLLKAFSEQGLLFYTHYDSQKGLDLLQQPKASVNFFWPELDQQIRINGRIERLTHEESKTYFQSRPIDSQLSASISHQSQPVESRAALEAQMAKAAEKMTGKTIELPENWGGYRLIPQEFEFWQGRPNRLHDRFRYRLQPSQDWLIERLAP